ncbi:phosphatidylinositol transfer protein 3 isoform X2 [Neltuma alba]|nr:phosphatidylinositol transfer protein 3-like isoform X2 [Prosopis alba]
MMKETLKWRVEYRPEKIRWDDVSCEAKTGRLYRADFLDKQGRIVLVMRAGVQSTSSAVEQIKYLVYCMENAILNLNSDQEQMIWLVDFQGWSKSSVSLKVTKETAQLLQNHYPERLGLAILYNPPKLFESFWTMVKPFLEPKTYRKVRFVYPENPKSRKIMEEVFDMDKLESRFGGKNPAGFNYEAYALRLREDDKKISDFADSGCSSPTVLQSVMAETLQPESPASENGCQDESSCDEADSSKAEKEDETILGQSPCSQDDGQDAKVGGVKIAQAG